MIKYRTDPYAAMIEKVECERETSTNVWVKGKRFAKFSDYYRYFDTFSGARSYLLGMANIKVQSARSELRRAESYAGEVKAALRRAKKYLGEVKGLKE